MKYVLSAVLAAFILTGCGDDEVELVKNYTLPDFKSMSIGTAIEGSKICKSVTWSKEENGGLKTVRMVCDVDMERMKVKIVQDKTESLKSYKQRALDTSLNNAMIYYKSKVYDEQGLLKLAKEHCKLNEVKFQEAFKTKGKIEFDDEDKIVDCDDKLKGEFQKEYSVDYIIEYLKRAVYYSQLTVEQYDAVFGRKKVEYPSKAVIELNFIVNADKSISLSDKFMVTEDVADDIIKTSSFTGKRVAEDALVIFYERK
nr:hypothetical protein [uncultured Campylobacter sp.]